MEENALSDAIELFNKNDLVEAKNKFSEILEEEPNNVDANHFMGVISIFEQRYSDAIQYCRNVIARAPQHSEAYLNLANAILQLGDIGAAQSAYNTALAINPGSYLALQNLSEIANSFGNFPDGENYARESLRFAPTNTADRSLVSLSNALRGQGRIIEAIGALHQALSTNPSTQSILSRLASIIMDIGDVDKSLIFYKLAVNINPNELQANMDLLDALSKLGDIDEAEIVARHIVDLAPNFLQGISSLGWCLRGAGKFEEAKEMFNRCLEIDPDNVDTYWNLSVIDRTKEKDEKKENQLREYMRRDTFTPFQKATAGFSLGKILDDQDRLDEAFEVFKESNEIIHEDQINRGMGFSSQGFTADVNRLIKHYTKDNFEKYKSLGIKTELPVYIAGMPRSGTTLIEQIAASHSEVMGLGETYDFVPVMVALEGDNRWNGDVIKDMAKNHLSRIIRRGGDKLRIVDKTPDNVILMGYIATLFPQARFILSKRDLRDVCLSHYFQLYTNGNAFSYNLKECAWRVKETERLMDHWKSALSDRIIEIEYEKLVENIDNESRRLIDFLGLKWEDSCLEFYNNKRPIATPNMWGIRQPVYNRQVGRWKLYEKYLGEIL